jgi:hypothetical protein
MIWLSRQLALAVVVFVVQTSAALAAPSDADAREFARKTAFARRVVSCGPRSFILSNDDQLVQVDRPDYLPTSFGLTRADQLNGIDYQGQVQLTVGAYRPFNRKAHSWPDWQDPNAFNATLTALFNPGAPHLALYTVLVQHKNAQWFILQDALNIAAEFDCAKVDSIETGTFKENTVQLSGDAPRPFEPNAVLNRAYPFKGDCTPAAGTKVMDLGTDKALPDFKSVVVDPAVCPPKSRFVTAGIVPPDAVESIQQWNDHPVAAPSPPTQIATSSPVARPAPATAAVDPSRASLSHSSTQTFYTTAPVPVYVHGLHGALLCIVPARTSVPARVQNRPPQFSGDYGVLAYKADLCPNAAGTQPRDLYHEFFFRATGAPSAH